MLSIAIRLDPTILPNPDADLRYLLPDLMVQRSQGLLSDDGYDYLDDGRMLVFLRADQDPDAALAIVAETVRTEELLGNSLAVAVVAVETDDGWRVAYPADHADEFNIE